MKMRMNWGWKIAVLFTGFVVMILVLVGMSVSQKIDLVSDDYYAMELIHQQKIDKIKRARALDERVSWNISDQFLDVSFPANMDINAIGGNIILYCPADDRKDLVIPIALNEGSTQRIPKDGIQAGRYRLQVDWSANNLTYWDEGVINIGG